MTESIQAARVGEVQRSGDGVAALEFRFPASQPVFAGHFPGHPILPGVFQLEMVRMAAEEVTGNALVVREISKAKFRRPILPDETIRVELRLTELANELQARAVFSVSAQPAGETMLRLVPRQ